MEGYKSKFQEVDETEHDASELNQKILAFLSELEEHDFSAFSHEFDRRLIRDGLSQIQDTIRYILKNHL